MNKRTLAAMRPATSTSRFASFVAIGLLLASGGCSEQPTHLLGGGSQGGGSSNAGAGSGTGGTNQGGQASGGESASGGQAPQPASFAISVSDTAAEIELADSVDLTVSVAANGYVGDVALAVSGLPSDVSGALASPIVTLTGSGSETVTLTLSSASDTFTGDFPYTVTGTVVTGSKDTQAVVTVLPVLTIDIPDNLASFISDPPDTTAFGPYPTMVRALPDMNATPITVRFYNGDTIPHEIHSDQGAQGFFHSQANIPPGGFDEDRNVTAPGTYNYYPHDLGTGILGRIVIQ